MDLNDDRFVYATNTATGAKQRVPRHFIDHPVLGKNLKLAPSQAHADMVGQTPSLEWTAEQLRAYAAEHGVDLAGAKNKPDVLAAIEAATAATPTSTDTALVSVETPATGETE